MYASSTQGSIPKPGLMPPRIQCLRECEYRGEAQVRPPKYVPNSSVEIPGKILRLTKTIRLLAKLPTLPLLSLGIVRWSIQPIYVPLFSKIQSLRAFGGRLRKRELQKGFCVFSTQSAEDGSPISKGWIPDMKRNCHP